MVNGWDVHALGYPCYRDLEQRDVYRVFGIKISPLATKEIKRAHNPSSVVQWRKYYNSSPQVTRIAEEIIHSISTKVQKTRLSQNQLQKTQLLMSLMKMFEVWHIFHLKTEETSRQLVVQSQCCEYFFRKNQYINTEQSRTSTTRCKLTKCIKNLLLIEISLSLIRANP